MEKHCLFVAGHKINQMMIIEARARMAIEVVQSLEARVKNFCRYCKKDTHFISECYKLKNKEKRTDTYRLKVILMKVMPLLLLLLIVQIVLRFLLLLLDVQIMMMNGFLILLLPFIYTLIEIGSSLMIKSKVVLLEWVMIVHIKLLALDLFRLRLKDRYGEQERGE
jgi:hypothetical protein